MPAAAADAHVQLAGVGRSSCGSLHLSRCQTADAPTHLCYRTGQLDTDVGLLLDQRSMTSSSQQDMQQPAPATILIEGSDHNISHVLEQAGPHTAELEQILQAELAQLASSEGTLSKVGSLLQQHRSNHRLSAGSVNCQQQSGSVHVLPLMGLTLAQLLSILQQQFTQHKQQPGAPPSMGSCSVLLQQLLRPGSTPLSAALCNSSCGTNGHTSSSPFLSALAAETLRIRQVVAQCYHMIEGRVANIGQHLPPIPDAAGEEHRPRKCRRQNPVDDTASTSVEHPQSPTAAAADSATGIDPSSSSTAYCSLGVGELSLLHDHASAASSDLVQLDDFISVSYVKLARLAQQYDTLLTAAATDACSSNNSCSTAASNGSTASRAVSPAVAAGKASSSKLGLLGLLARRHQHHQQQRQQQEGSGVLGCSDTASSGPLDVEFILYTPGVRSHSSYHSQAHKYTAGVPPDIYHQCVHKLITTGHGPEPVLWGLSVIYARIRHAAEAAAAAAAEAASEPETAVEAGAAAEWTAPDQFTRKTTKYWIHPSNILRLKVALLRHLPLLVYGAADPVYRGDIHTRQALTSGSHDVTSLVSSVYFDNRQLDVYHTRLARDDNARLVRLRYYGPRQLGPPGQQQPVFVERKTHRQKWTGERSVKERANLAQSQVPGYLSGVLPPAELSNKETKSELLTEVLAFIQNSHLVPAVRTEYLRTAWQRYDSNTVRLSLDEHMLLLREKQATPGTAGAATGSGCDDEWCASVEGSAQLAAGDVVRFPYNILEIKLQDEAPEWIRELKKSGILVKCPKFSKFLHGMALLYPDRCEHTPRWFIWDEAAETASPATLDEMREMRPPRDPAEGDCKVEADSGTANNVASPDNNQRITAAAPALSRTTSSTAAAGSAAIASLLPSPSLAPLKIPRFDPSGVPDASKTETLYPVALSVHTNGRHHPQRSSAGGSATAAGEAMGHLPPTAAAAATYAELDAWIQASKPAHTATAIGSHVLCGIGLHTPKQRGDSHRLMGTDVLPTSNGGSGYSSDGSTALHGGVGGVGGGSGAFNAGINSSTDSGFTDHRRISGSPLVPDTATLLPRTFHYSHAERQRQRISAPAGLAPAAAADHAVITVDSSPADVAAAAPCGCSPTSSSSIRRSGSGGIKRLVGMMMGVGKRNNRNSSSSEQQQEFDGPVVQLRSDTSTSHHSLSVTNPLEIHQIHSRHHHHHDNHHQSGHPQHPSSSCSTSSQDTETTGSWVRHVHECHSTTSSSLGLPSIHDSSPTAAGASAAAGEMLLVPAAAKVSISRGLNGYSSGSGSSSYTSSSWQLSTAPPVALDLLTAKGPWAHLDRLSAPAATATNAAFYPDCKSAAPASGWSLKQNLGLCQDKSGWNHLAACKDTARSLDLPSLLSQHISSAAQQQQQQHVIQVNHVRQAEADSNQNWPATAAAGTAAAAASLLPGQHSPAVDKDLQQYLPPVSSAGAVGGSPTAVMAVSADQKLANGFEVHMNGDCSISTSTLGPDGGAGAGAAKKKRSRARALFQQIKAAAGRSRWRGRGKEPAGGGGSGRNEHMLGFSGSAPRTRAIVRARAEPKTFFANERTFLSWLQISVLVMMTGMGLLGGSTLVEKHGGDAGLSCMDNMVCSASRISGAIITPVSVLFMLYALYTFKKRTHRILHQMDTVRYDDQLGPTLLTVLLVGVTVVSLALSLKSVFAN